MDFFLAKKKRLQDIELKKRMTETAAKTVLKYGVPSTWGYNCDQLEEFWDYDSRMPHSQNFNSSIRIADVKRVLNTAIKIDHKIWNSDFLHGLAVNCCTVTEGKRSFPSIGWRHNENITKLIDACPFGGFKCKHFNTQSNEVKSWQCAPILGVPYNKNSVSFVAGLLSAGKIVKEGDYYYVKYHSEAIKVLKELKIPIEKERKEKSYRGYNHYVFISPMWPALFSPRMPKFIRAKWHDLKNAYRADIYSPILWRTYVNSIFQVRGIPYLKSKRMIYYQYKCEEGAMKWLERLRFQLGLAEIDYSIRDMVKEWANNYKKDV